MIHTYTFYESDVNKLNGFVLSFFNKIEFEKGDFTTNFFEKEFYDNLVSRHKLILGKSFKDIFEIVKTWHQFEITKLCSSIRNSNEIEKICRGIVVPTKSTDIPIDVKDLLITLFQKLYNDVLFGKYFKPHYGDRKTHYHSFKKCLKNDYEKCPACGIKDLHNSDEDITEQYDHYLSKDIYPFSAVNFKNLIPICNDCNSILVKSNDDILRHSGKVFYPFEAKKKLIDIKLKIIKNDSSNLEKIEWGLAYKVDAGKQDELSAWKAIYNVEERHKKHASGWITKWNDRLWDYLNDRKIKKIIPDINSRFESYILTKSGNLFESQALKNIYKPQLLKALDSSSKFSRY